MLAVLVAGAAGGLFSPIAGRLRGAYLGIATLALVFIGQHVLFNARDLTGGFNGRDVPPLELFGLAFDDTRTGRRRRAVRVGREALVPRAARCSSAGALFARGVLRGRPGRAMNAIRDHRIAAGVMGVPVARYRAARLRPVLDVRGPRRGTARPGLPADRARVLRDARSRSSTSP